MATIENTLQHVAVIMDGNGRWATAQGKSRTEGHRAGAKTARAIIEHALEMHIGHLTFYTLSTENLKRPIHEVTFLFELLKQFIRKELKSFVEADVRIKVIGNRTLLPRDVLSAVESAEQQTEECSRLICVIALAYGSRDEIVRACQQARFKGSGLTENDISRHLDTAGIPDPDLIIRPGGEKRLSNFLLWQAEYTELEFVDTLWPDFSTDQFQRIVEEVSSRQRRYGRLPEPVAAE